MRLIISVSAITVADPRMELKTIQAKIKYTMAARRLLTRSQDLGRKATILKNEAKKLTGMKKSRKLVAVKKVRFQQKAVHEKYKAFVAKNKKYISRTPVDQLQKRGAILADKIKKLDKKPAQKVAARRGWKPKTVEQSKKDLKAKITELKAQLSKRGSKGDASLQRKLTLAQNRLKKLSARKPVSSAVKSSPIKLSKLDQYRLGNMVGGRPESAEKRK